MITTEWACPNCGARYDTCWWECEEVTCKPSPRFADSGPGPGPLRDRLMAAEHAHLAALEVSRATSEETE